MENGSIRVEYQEYFCEMGVADITIEDARKVARDFFDIPDNVIPRIGLRMVPFKRILAKGETVLFVDRP